MITNEEFEKLLEEAFWNYDAMHRGYNEHRLAPKSERDAFKYAVRSLVREITRREETEKS